MNASHARTSLLSGLCLLALSLAGACADREHIRDDYGIKTRAFMQKQHVHAEASQDSPTGLDSEEAALIQSKYRDGMGDGKVSDESAQVMVIEQPKQGKGK